MQMPIDPVEKFADNWAYLKAELNWLERILMLAVARQRKETKDIDRLAQSRADRVTSHWWKGVISLEAEVSYDEHRKTPHAASSIAKPGYQQQLETRIRASHQQGIVLGLPLLCDRLELTLFEKNLILMSLAPEVNRRYARLYRYLQGDDLPLKTDLPTVDLALRLLCRNDHEWRAARNRLATTSPLVQHDLLRFLPAVADSLLNQSSKLDEALISYLLAEQPTMQGLDSLLKVPVSICFSSHLVSRSAAIDWSALILPTLLLASLQHLGQRLKVQAEVNAAWDLEKAHSISQPGSLALLVGAAGTGKTLVAKALAHSLQMPLTSVDLALLNPEAQAQVLQEILAQPPKVLLIQSAHLWFGRSAALTAAEAAQLLDQRRSIVGITLLETRFNHAIRPHWRRQIQTLALPLPDRHDRLRLWQQAFPAQVTLDPEIDWNLIAQVALSGGEIEAIAREAAVFLTVSGEAYLNLRHIAQALEQYGKVLRPVRSTPAKQRSRQKPTQKQSDAVRSRSTPKKQSRDL